MRITCKNLTSVHRIWFLQSCAASRTPRPVGPTAPVPGRGAGYDWPYRGLWKFDWTRLSLLGLLGHGPKPCSRSEGEPRRQSRPSRCTPARKIALAEVKTVARLFSTVTGRSFKFCMWSVLYCRAGSRGRLGGCEQILDSIAPTLCATLEDRRCLSVAQDCAPFGCLRNAGLMELWN
ncbi:unnamed protein product [Penicillium manginii]